MECKDDDDASVSILALTQEKNVPESVGRKEGRCEMRGEPIDAACSLDFGNAEILTWKMGIAWVV